MENSFFSLQNDKNYNLKDTSKFGYYLTGLIEGDGTILTPKQERDSKNRLCYPSIQITFNLKDLPLALIIQKELGFGALTRQKGVNAYRLTINNLEGLLLLVFLLNGKMKTPKIIDLWKLIDWLNLKIITLNLKKYPINNEHIKNNQWFSGFIDADGHFSIRTTNNNKMTKIVCKFVLVQSQKDHNNNDKIEFLHYIADYLSTTVKLIRNNKPKPEYSVRTVNLTGNLNLKFYLEKNPLFSSKYLDYNDWLKVLYFFEKGRVNHRINIDYAILIKAGINDKRTKFFWDHLQNFYSLER